MNIVKALNIKKVYGESKKHASTVALNGIDFTVKEGDFTAIMGPSGSGKTTLLNILAGFDEATAGEVWVKGSNLSSKSLKELAEFRRKNIGFVFQNYNLLDSLTVKENIMLPIILEKKDIKSNLKKAEDLMKLLNIHEIADKYPHKISGGEQQRTAVGRAIINDTAILLADEPTGNLDSKSARDVMECLKKLNKTSNTTIVLVTHDPYAASCSNKTVFIKDGKIVTQVYKKADQKEFFEDIIDNLSALEVRAYEL
ncbi:ABC transporter ATP-binding protein [Oceanirhabdus sp. W0125-5]|uniref:ABC transporter ATP-binding protein n=1 Tax=Oceanirhabdus sp. W0125-5 TaxID=2999116 RepID=UPI0022F312C3|nr:ABC transporter ATP-binding protein [Oceanirhabdus sp. W0125-5]WBW96745.1 ABC transporter ATP-binding protein [Oceanirhabdus sp. W0125-5]